MKKVFFVIFLFIGIIVNQVLAQGFIHYVNLGKFNYYVVNSANNDKFDLQKGKIYYNGDNTDYSIVLITQGDINDDFRVSVVLNKFNLEKFRNVIKSYYAFINNNDNKISIRKNINVDFNALEFYLGGMDGEDSETLIVPNDALSFEFLMDKEARFLMLFKEITSKKFSSVKLKTTFYFDKKQIDNLYYLLDNRYIEKVIRIQEEELERKFKKLERKFK